MALVTISGTIPEVPGEADQWPWRITSSGVVTHVSPNGSELSFQVEAGAFLLRNPIDGVTRSCTATADSDLWTVFNAGQRVLSPEEQHLVGRLEALGVGSGGGVTYPQWKNSHKTAGDLPNYSEEIPYPFCAMEPNEDLLLILPEGSAGVLVQLPQDPAPGDGVHLQINVLASDAMVGIYGNVAAGMLGQTVGPIGAPPSSGRGVQALQLQGANTVIQLGLKWAIGATPGGEAEGYWQYTLRDLPPLNPQLDFAHSAWKAGSGFFYRNPDTNNWEGVSLVELKAMLDALP